MRNNKKKGFTLMEILATVVILGIISTIGIVSVNKVLDKSHKEYEVKQAKMVTTAAQSYFTDNKSLLPQEVLKTEFVKLQELINNNYIDEVVDYKKEKYDYDKSITTVRKMAANRYVYYSKLIRQDGSKAVDENPEKMDSSAITINLSLSDNNSYKKYNNDTSYYVKEKTLVDVKMSSSDKIAVYKYIIYKVAGSTEKKYKKSENIVIDKNSYDDKIVLSKENLIDGKYKLEVVAYGYDGIPNRKNISQIVIDATKPKCTIKKANNPTSKRGWYNSEVELKMVVDDKNPYKYSFNTTTLNEYETPIPSIRIRNTTGKSYQGKIIDKAGNEGNCISDLYKVDTTKPSCDAVIKDSSGNIVASNVWTNKDVTVEGKCTDNDSDCFKTIVTKERKVVDGDYLQELVPIEVEDNAGNTNSCSVYVKIDKELPTCTTTIYGNKTSNPSLAWYNTDVLFYGICNDSVSDCKENTTQNLYNYESNSIWGSAGVVYDNAGNSRQCETQFLGIDKTPPSCGAASETNPVVVSCTDTLSGPANSISVPYEETGWIELGYCYDNADNFTNCGNKYVTFSEIDDDCNISSISIYNPYGGTWRNASHTSYKLTVTWDSSENIASIYRKYDNGSWSELDASRINNNESKFVSGDFDTSRNSKVCYKIETESGCTAKICTRVKVDMDRPTHNEWCICNNSSFAGSGGAVYNFVQKMKLKDDMSGLKSSTWEWSSNGMTYNNGPLTNDFYNGRKEWFGYIGVSTSGGPYKYIIEDIAGNTTEGEKYLNSMTPLQTPCNCTSHTS